MAKKIIKRPMRPGSDEIEEVEVDDDNGVETHTGEGEIPSQLVPYPTGGQYKPPLEYLAEEAAAPEGDAKAKAKSKEK